MQGDPPLQWWIHQINTAGGASGSTTYHQHGDGVFEVVCAFCAGIVAYYVEFIAS